MFEKPNMKSNTQWQRECKSFLHPALHELPVMVNEAGSTFYGGDVSANLAKLPWLRGALICKGTYFERLRYPSLAEGFLYLKRFGMSAPLMLTISILHIDAECEVFR